MAYMNQQKKADIAAALKLVVPKGWKYSLAVRNHSTIVFTVAAAPIDLLAVCKYPNKRDFNGSVTLNPYYLEHAFDGGLLDTFKKIHDALNLNNHDNSDIMTDYFDVGHYVDMRVGKWDKPFEVLA